MRIDKYLDAEREWRKKEQLKIQKISEQRRKEVVSIAWKAVKQGKLNVFDYIGVCKSNKQKIF